MQHLYGDMESEDTEDLGGDSRIK